MTVLLANLVPGKRDGPISVVTHNAGGVYLGVPILYYCLIKIKKRFRSGVYPLELVRLSACSWWASFFPIDPLLEVPQNLQSKESEQR